MLKVKISNPRCLMQFKNVRNQKAKIRNKEIIILYTTTNQVFRVHDNND